MMNPLRFLMRRSRGVLYARGNGLYWKGSGGTNTRIVTTSKPFGGGDGVLGIRNAFCAQCRNDFVATYRNAGQRLAVCLWCGQGLAT